MFKNKTRKIISAIVCAALLVAIAAIVVYAIVIKNAEGTSDNSFSAGVIDCKIISDGTSYTVKNTGNADAYIRAIVLVNWRKDNKYLPKTTVPLSADNVEGGWEKNTETGIYYFNSAVSAGNSTSKLIIDKSAIENANASATPDGATLEIRVFAEAIQVIEGRSYADTWAYAESQGTVSDEIVSTPEAPDAPTEACSHNWLDATCETAKTCSKCGATEGTSLGHVEASDAAVDPTCTDTGLTAGSHCSRCNKILTPQVTVDALGHSYDPNNDYKCTRCGASQPEIPDVPISRTHHDPYEYYRCGSCGFISIKDGASQVGDFSIDSFMHQTTKTNYAAGGVPANNEFIVSETSGLLDLSGWVVFDTSNYELGYQRGDLYNTWSLSVNSSPEDAVLNKATEAGCSNAVRFTYYFSPTIENGGTGETVHLILKDKNTGLKYCFFEFTYRSSGIVPNAPAAMGSVDGAKHQLGTDYTQQFKAANANGTINVTQNSGVVSIGGWMATTLTNYSYSWRLNEEYRNYSFDAPYVRNDAISSAQAKLGSSATALQYTFYLGLENIKSGDSIYFFIKDNNTGIEYCFAKYTINITDNANNYSYKSNYSSPDNSVVGSSQMTSNDGNLKMWFDHLTQKVARYDVSNINSSNSSYTIQMAKNEIEGCHFYLYYPSEKHVTIEYTDFTSTSGSGETLKTELGVEFYYQQYSMNQKGFNEGTSADGKSIAVYPDAVIPYESYVNATEFYASKGINYDEGGSYTYGPWVPIGPYSENPSNTSAYPYREAIRGFVVQATTSKHTSPGQYSATVTIKDAASGAILKTAVVYTYVYNVTLNDEPALDTYIGMHYSNIETINNGFGIRSQDAIVALADFMLDYRLTPVWGGWAYEAYFGYEWMHDPRVTTIRVHKEFYDKWKDDPIIASKMVYYGQDEPGAPRNQYRGITFKDGSTANYFDQYGILAILGVAEEAKMLRDTWGWTDYRLIAPVERNIDFDDLAHFPDITKNGYINLNWDTIYASLNTTEAQNFYNSYKSELENSSDMFEFLSNYLSVWVYTYTGSTPKALNSTGCYYMQSAANDVVYGEFAERMKKYQAKGDEIWGYVACEPQWDKPYQNILLFNDGTEARTMYWTSYKLGQTGWLYWREEFYPSTVSNTYAMRNPFSATGPGDGILLYPGGIYGQVDPIPSIRMMNMRDGIEDYELLCMLEDKYDEATAMALVENLVTSTVTFTKDDDKVYNVHAKLLQLLEAAN